jgi:hypothetical protein
MKITDALAIIFIEVGFYLRYLFTAVILAAGKRLGKRRSYYFLYYNTWLHHGIGVIACRQHLLPGCTFCETKNKCLRSFVAGSSQYPVSFYSNFLYFLPE